MFLALLSFTVRREASGCMPSSNYTKPCQLSFVYSCLQASQLFWPISILNKLRENPIPWATLYSSEMWVTCCTPSFPLKEKLQVWVIFLGTELSWVGGGAHVDKVNLVILFHCSCSWLCPWGLLQLLHCNMKNFNSHKSVLVNVVHSLTQLCLTLCNPWTAGFPVLHCLLEDAQTHVHWVDDAIQPLHPLSSPSPPVFNLFQQQGFFPMSPLFASGGQSTGASASASVLQ